MYSNNNLGISLGNNRSNNVRKENMKTETKEINVADVKVTKLNPREINKKELKSSDLYQSIKDNGIQVPIMVRKNGKLELLAGERRLSIAKDLKIEKIPAIIYCLSQFLQ